MHSTTIIERELPEVLRLQEVIRATGMRRSTIYEAMADGRFPQPIPLHGRCVGWLANEVREWVHQRIRERDARQSTPAEASA